jgi:hypothetical protein
LPRLHIELLRLVFPPSYFIIPCSAFGVHFPSYPNIPTKEVTLACFFSATLGFFPPRRWVFRDLCEQEATEKIEAYARCFAGVHCFLRATFLRVSALFLDAFEFGHVQEIEIIESSMRYSNCSHGMWTPDCGRGGGR